MNRSLPDMGFVRISQILKVIPIGKTTWWEGVKSGRFPKPIKIGERTTVWQVEDIKDLIQQYMVLKKQEGEVSKLNNKQDNLL